MSTGVPAPAGRSASRLLACGLGLLLLLGLLSLPPLLPGDVGQSVEARAARSPVDPQAVRVRTRAVGFSPGFQIIDASPAALRKQLRGMRDVGARRLRIDISWARVEATRGHYDWTDIDRVVLRARAAGFKVLGVLGYEPAWAHHTSYAASLDPSAFASFAAAAARRYAGRVSAWELWNEPNSGRFWSPGPDPEAYARLVAETAPHVRAEDPSAKVVVGALAPGVDAADGSELSPETFLGRFYDALPRSGLFDAVSVHPYSYPAMPGDEESWNTFARLPDLHDVMVRAGDGDLPLWLTEYGAPTGHSLRAVSPRRQARMLVAALRQARQLAFVGPIFVYSYQDAGADNGDLEHNFGVVDHRGRPKPAFWALRRELSPGAG